MVYSAIYISSYWCRMHPTSLPNKRPTSIPNLIHSPYTEEKCKTDYTEEKCKTDYTEGKCKMDFGL